MRRFFLRRSSHPAVPGYRVNAQRFQIRGGARRIEIDATCLPLVLNRWCQLAPKQGYAERSDAKQEVVAWALFDERWWAKVEHPPSPIGMGWQLDEVACG